MFPKFLVKKMYVRKTLKTTENGFSFTIKNNLVNGSVVKVYQLTFNETEIDYNRITVKSEDKQMFGGEINEENPFPLKKGKNTHFIVEHSLDPDLIGTQVKIEFKFKIKGVSTITFPIADELAKGM